MSINQSPTEASFSPSLDNVFYNGLDIVCLQTGNLDKRLKSHAQARKSFATDSIEAYADAVEVMSDVTHAYSNIDQRIEEMTLNDNEFLRSY